MQKLNFTIPKPDTKLCATEWQDRALEVIEDLNVPLKLHTVFFMHFKKNREKAESSYRYLMDNPKDTPHRYFLWLMSH